MTADIDYLPVWKDNATACERLMELAHIARKHPERFCRMVVVYEEDLPKKDKETYPATRTRWHTSGMHNTEAIGVLELGKHHIIKHMFGEE